MSNGIITEISHMTPQEKEDFISTCGTVTIIAVIGTYEIYNIFTGNGIDANALIAGVGGIAGISAVNITQVLSKLGVNV